MSCVLHEGVYACDASGRDRNTEPDTIADSDPDTGLPTETGVPEGCEGAIQFPDALLEQGIREAIDKSEGDIFYGDVEHIEWLIVCYDSVGPVFPESSGVSDLTGMACLTNLENLALWENNIEDIIPLAGLTTLTEIDLSGNQVSDISPLKHLTNLEFLHLGENSISSISAINGLTNLKSLFAFDNDIGDISVLFDLTNLTLLNLRENNISDISAIAGLTGLTDLFISGNNISSISALAELTDLTNLDLENNPIDDITALEGLNQLEFLDLGQCSFTNIAPLVANEGIDAGDNVFLAGTPIDCKDSTTLNHLATLADRGVNLFHDCE